MSLIKDKIAPPVIDLISCSCIKNIICSQLLTLFGHKYKAGFIFSQRSPPKASQQSLTQLVFWASPPQFDASYRDEWNWRGRSSNSYSKLYGAVATCQMQIFCCQFSSGGRATCDLGGALQRLIIFLKPKIWTEGDSAAAIHWINKANSSRQCLAVWYSRNGLL